MATSFEVAFERTMTAKLSFIQKNNFLSPTKVATVQRMQRPTTPPSSTQRALDYFQSVVFMTGINMTCSLWFLLKIYLLNFLCLVHSIWKQCDISVVQIYKVYFHTNLLWMTIFAIWKFIPILFYFLRILHVPAI